MDFYALTKADVDKQRVVNGIVLGTPRGEPFHENEGRVSARVPPHRLVQLTEEVSVATYDGESPTALGSGKGKFRIAQSDGSSIGSVEEEEYDILSLDTSTHAAGKTVLVYRMQDLAGSQYAEPGWVIPKSSEAAAERCLYLCGSQTLAVANNDTNQQLQLVAYNNFDATTYQINAAEWSVTLLREGRYEVRHDFTLTGASAGTDNHATESATAYFRNGSTLGTSVVGCSGVLMQVTSFASELGFENAGRTWHAISPGGMTPHKIDWVVKRNTWTNGSNVNLTSARIRFLGNITPTTGIFDAPGP